jgi:hypothetical protein
VIRFCAFVAARSVLHPTVWCDFSSFLDDLLGLCVGRQNALRVAAAVIKRCADLGYVLNVDPVKLVTAVKRLVYLGIGLDLSTFELYVDPIKKAKAVAALNRLASSSHVPEPKLRSLIGKLIFVATALPPCRSFIGELQNALRHAQPGSVVVLSTDCRNDARTFASIIDTWSGRPMVLPTRLSSAKNVLDYGVTFAADAGGEHGWGCWYLDTTTNTVFYAYGRWLPNQRTSAGVHISVLELAALLGAQHSILRDMHDCIVCARTDNTQTESFVNATWARGTRANRLLRHSQFFSARTNTYMIARHIPGSKNPWSDNLSRGAIAEFLRDLPSGMQARRVRASKSFYQVLNNCF